MSHGCSAHSSLLISNGRTGLSTFSCSQRIYLRSYGLLLHSWVVPWTNIFEPMHLVDVALCMGQDICSYGNPFIQRSQSLQSPSFPLNSIREVKGARAEVGGAGDLQCTVGHEIVSIRTIVERC